MKAIKLNLVITSLRSLANLGASLSAHTPPLTEEELTAIFKLQGRDCEAVIAPKAKYEGVIEIDADLKHKPQSQRIRNCLYVWWEQSGKSGKFEDWYKEKTEMVIEWIKRKYDFKE